MHFYPMPTLYFDNFTHKAILLVAKEINKVLMLLINVFERPTF